MQHPEVEVLSPGEYGENWSSAVLAVLPDRQTPLVVDMSRSNPLWKLPVGRRDFDVDSTPYETAVRELEGETGAVARVEDVVWLYTEEAGNHLRHYFFVLAQYPPSGELRKHTDDDVYELVGSFPFDEVAAKDDLLPVHRDVIVSKDTQMRLERALRAFLVA